MKAGTVFVRSWAEFGLEGTEVVKNRMEIVFSLGGFCAESPSDNLLQPRSLPADHGVVFVLTHTASLLECPAWS